MSLERAKSGWLVAAVPTAVLGGLIATLIAQREPAHPAEGDAQSAEDRAAVPAPAVAAADTPAARPPSQAPATEPARCPPEPALELGNSLSGSITRALLGKPSMLGSASIGTHTRGSLSGGVELQSNEGIERAGGYGWGTESVILSLERAAREVRRCHPGAGRLYVGDISRENGGWLRPHRSHQSGLDADVGFYYIGPATWYQRPTAQTLDAARTWTLMRALMEGGNVETIFLDRSIQIMLEAYLAKLPKSEQPPEGTFERSRRQPAIIRHAWGHATHFHVRFLDPQAVELGRRVGLLEGPPGSLKVPPWRRLRR